MANTNRKESGIKGHPYFDPELDLPGAKSKVLGDSYMGTAGQQEPDPNTLRRRVWPNGKGTLSFLAATLGATVHTEGIARLGVALKETTHTPEPEALKEFHTKLQAVPVSTDHSFGGPLHLTEATAPPAQKDDSASEATSMPRRTPGGTLTGMTPVTLEPVADISQLPTPTE